MSNFILEDDFIEPSTLYIPEYNSFRELIPSIEYSIDKKSFIDELTCPICLDIVENPILCNTCECMICENVIIKWKLKTFVLVVIVFL